MVEPRHQPVSPTGRYSGIKEQPQRNWDRNKARMDSIYQLPLRDFRQTAAQFGVPPSIADITTEKGIPKMECTTTTKNDYCAPSLDRYIKVQGVCPEKDYPSSSGLEYCPEREVEPKPTLQFPTKIPPMPYSKSTCPVSTESLLPKVSPVSQLKYQPQYLRTVQHDEVSEMPPKVKGSEQTDYRPNVDYLSANNDFKWPSPADQFGSATQQTGPQEDNYSKAIKDDKLEIMEKDSKSLEEYRQFLKYRGGDGDTNRQLIDYPVETEDHAQKRLLHDAMLERARMNYEKNIGTPGSTIPLMKAGADPPNAVAHYNVPDYTQGSPAGGMIRSKFGAPNWEMKMPITDPSYPKPQNKIPPPEAGLTKSTYSVTAEEDNGKAGVALTPPVRFPDKIYNSERIAEPDKTGNSFHVSTGAAERYTPSIIEAQDKLIPTRSQQISQTAGGPTEWTQHDEKSSETPSDTAKVEPVSLKGLRRIQTSNQVYGSWIDDPYLKDNDWWFKARPTNPRTKTYLSRYKEENGWQ